MFAPDVAAVPYVDSRSDPEQQADGSPTVHSILCKGIHQATEVGVRGEMQHGLKGCRIYADVEVAEENEWPATAAVVAIGRKQWMVEQIVNVRTEYRGYAFAKVERLVHPQVHSPSARAVQKVPFGDLSIVEEVGPHGGRPNAFGSQI